MAHQVSCALALSVNCDSTKENQDAFKAIFEEAFRKLGALAGAESHGNGNAQFYGGMDFPGGDLYLHERDIEPVRTLLGKK